MWECGAWESSDRGKEGGEERGDVEFSCSDFLSNVVIFAALSTLLTPLTFPRFYPEGK